MKNVIIETDIGHDPDDFFSLCYLYSAGANIRAITIHKGEPHQIALVRMFCKEVGLDIPVGATDLNVPECKKYVGEFEGKPVQVYVDFHHKLLERYGHPHTAKADDEGYKVIQNVYGKYPDSEFFVIGAPKNVSTFIGHYGSALSHMKIKQMTFQGGFLSYHVHQYPCERLPKFEGKMTFPSYNPNGDIKGTEAIVACPNIEHIRFVSKNVTHTLIYDKSMHDLMKLAPIKNRADEMFIEGMNIYLHKHSEKKFHDPCAAVCMMHPEIAQFVKGNLYHDKGGWGTHPDPTANRETIVTIDKEKFWQHILDKT
jgi:pyrimidine-specific ribonucleoside hydrolase